LVISADGIRSAFPFVSKLVHIAPEIDKWKIVAFRQPVTDFSEIQLLDIKLNLDDVYFRFAKDNGKLNIELNLKAMLNLRNGPDSPLFSLIHLSANTILR
jgi:hypothetical protein